MTSSEMDAKVLELESKLKDSEKRMLEFMSDMQKRRYLEDKVRMKEYEVKIKKRRDEAIRKQKEEYEFCKRVREREDEVMQFLTEPTASDSNEEIEEEIPNIDEREAQETASYMNGQYQNGYYNR